MPESIVPLESDEQLARVVARIGGGPLAVDTEADSFHSYRERVCLVQLTVGGEDVIVDPLAGVDLRLLGPPLADPAVRTIFHAADYDLRLLQRDHGLEVRGLFDTMIAARLVGEPRFGLAALLERYFDVPLNKKFQRADWSVRPLSSEMARYAAMDTRYLVPLHARLSARLEALGRSGWASEEFERLERIRGVSHGDPDRGFRRVKGSGKLERRKMAILRELWTLRETYARRLDRPPFRILHDERLLELSENPPLRTADLETMKKLPRPWRHGRRARELLAAVRTALELPRDKWPSRGKGGRGRAASKVPDERLAAIRKHRDRVAHELALEPSLIGPRAVLEQIVERLGSGQDPASTPELRRWQWELLAPATEPGPG